MPDSKMVQTQNQTWNKYAMPKSKMVCVWNKAQKCTISILRLKSKMVCVWNKAQHTYPMPKSKMVCVQNKTKNKYPMPEISDLDLEYVVQAQNNESTSEIYTWFFFHYNGIDLPCS